jgi:hypothetical protein
MGLYVNASVSMPTEMVEKIDARKGDWSRARYIRWCVRNADGTPFDAPEEELPDVSDMDTNETTEAEGVA